jgi:DNA (cytosine-5)-methyltransferase 1
MNANEGLSAVDLFCGAGGLSEGLKTAGFNIKLAIDLGEEQCRVYSYNHPSVKVLNADIKKIKRFSSALKWAGIKGKVKLLAGGSPCVGFSKANTKTRGAHPQNNLAFEFVRAIAEIMPEAFLIENVEGIMSVGCGEIAFKIISLLEKFGYCVQIMKLNAAEYGVPQKRKRIFLTGCFYGEARKPKPFPMSNNTVQDAIIGDLPPLAGSAGSEFMKYFAPPATEYQKYLRGSQKTLLDHVVTKHSERVTERMRLIPPGSSLVDLIKAGKIPKNLKIKVDHKSVYRRLSPDEPSVTIANVRKAMTIHPFEDRILSVREAARLQSFPDRYKFSPHVMYSQQMVADSVPPLLAKVVGKSIRQLLE